MRRKIVLFPVQTLASRSIRKDKFQFVWNRFCRFFAAFQVQVADFDGSVEDTASVLFIQTADNPKVADIQLWPGIKVNIAFDSGNAPEVLTFQVTVDAPVIDFDGCGVFARTKVRRDVKFGFQFRVFAVTHVLLVDPTVESRFDGTKVDEDFAPVPQSREGKGAPVQSYRIVTGGDVFHQPVRIGMADAKFAGMVDINRIAIGFSGVVKFPVCRNLKIIPIAYIVGIQVEINRTQGRIFYSFKRPQAIERLEISGLFLFPFFCQIQVFKREGARPHGEAVDVCDGNILPFFEYGWIFLFFAGWEKTELNCTRKSKIK